MTDRAISFSLSVRARPEAVWKAIVDPQLIPRWHHYERVKLDTLQAGGRFVFSAEGEPDDEGKIVEADPPRRLVYKWKSSEPDRTIVEYVLEPAGAYTILRFRNAGFKDGPVWDNYYDADFAGWVEITLKLKKLVES